ncbi:sigma-70 family RNA polymerase sigma factor [Pendulispora brunnea]|uniref:Sigma-70 family RNA polymerase sigma factor n=1 Tax=Pendulispora brunnea TaxID=2905690 RepID=A0ABZ2KAN8_9BACT
MRDPLRALRDARHARLLRASQSGDRAAFKSLYRALYEPVSGYVRRRVRTQAEAEDVVAQVFLQFVAALSKVDPERGTALAYVLAMARNVLADRARAASRPADHEALAPEASAVRDPYQALAEAEERATLRGHVAALPTEVQELLRLRYEEGLRYVEIAQIVGSGEAAVRQRISRAVRELRGAWNGTVQKGVMT